MKHYSAAQSAVVSIIKQINIAECCLVKWLPGYNKWLKNQSYEYKNICQYRCKNKTEDKIAGQVTRKRDTSVKWKDFLSNICYKQLKHLITCAGRINGSQNSRVQMDCLVINEWKKTIHT